MVAGLVGERNAQPSQQPAEINRIPAQLAPVEEVPNALDDGPRAAGFLLDIFDRLPQQLGVDRVLRQEPRARMSKRCRRRQRLAEPCTTATPNAPTVVKSRVPSKLGLLAAQELLSRMTLGHDGAENETGGRDDDRQELRTQEAIA